MNLSRVLTLLRKELLQMLRDPASIAVGVLLPVILLMMFGFGLSMNLNRVPAAVAMGESSPLAQSVLAAFRGSKYFDVTQTRSRTEAEQLLSARRIEAIIDLPPGLERDAASSSGAEIGITIHGVDASAATIIRTYAKATLAQMTERIRLRGAGSEEGLVPDAESAVAASSAGATLLSRSWFNEAATSSWHLVPGLTIVVLTLSASFLGSVAVAREWERGTMESLCVTPASPGEILAAKFLSNYGLICAGTLAATLAMRLVFGVPVRGSAILLALTYLLYDAWAVAFGLFLSARLRSQFVAIQIAVIGSYLPSLILSGYIFDLRSVPAFICVIGRLMPPTYAIESVKILCLSGGPERLVLSNLAILAAWAAGFLTLALAATRKRLD